MRARKIVAVLGCLAPLAGGARASVVYRTVPELTAEARQIVIGNVAEVTSFWDRGHQLIKSRVIVDVDQYLVGYGIGVEVLELPGGTVDSLTLSVSALPVFKVGDHVLLFLDDTELRLVAGFQGAYLTDGETVARMAPGCARVIHESRQPLKDLLDQISRGLPPGVVLPALAPYEGEFEIPAEGARYVTCGWSWAYQASPMGEDYVINPNCADPSAGDSASQILQIQNAADAWNNAGAEFSFTYGGTSSGTSGAYDGVNLVCFSNSVPFGLVAATYTWYDGVEIRECDMLFNDRDNAFWNGSGSCNYMMDIWSVAAHEFGHFLCLADLYGSGDVDKTMYFDMISFCDIRKRDLHQDDIDGIRAIYGFLAGGVWVDFTYVGYEDGSFSNPFNTLAEGVDAVPSGGTIRIKHGSTNEHPTISKPCTLTAFGGTVTIGQ